MGIFRGLTAMKRILVGSEGIKKAYWGSSLIWEKPTFKGLTFTANTAGSTVAMSVTGTPTLKQNFSYSTDGTNWSTFTPGTTTITLANAGDKVYFKGNNPNGVNQAIRIYYQFVMTGSIAASGNIMSLIDNGTCSTLTIPNNMCFLQLFQNCSSLTTAPSLPATTLKSNCYYNMFGSCSSLTTAPSLPATTLQTGCYNTMFANCSSLTTAPSLPATTLVNSCYYGMFSNCSALTTPPQLPGTAISSASGCYNSMFENCTSLYVSDSAVSGVATQQWVIPASGKFVTSKTLTFTGMFSFCLGTRSSNNMVAYNNRTCTYYTQNAPV